MRKVGQGFTIFSAARTHTSLRFEWPLASWCRKIYGRTYGITAAGLPLSRSRSGIRSLWKTGFEAKTFVRVDEEMATVG